MKIQSKNTIYRKVTAGCFICNKSRFGTIPTTSQMFIRCRDYESKCPISNLFNDKIFKL
jgi:hypothetical protein